MEQHSQSKIAFLFPGQGAQYVGMARDFVQNFSTARSTFEEADEILKRPLSKLILEGPEELLTQTKNSQTGIYVASLAILRVFKELYPIQPFVCAGLSLGEYTALTAAGWLSFQEALPLVQHRGEFMNQACEEIPGTMAVVLGLSNEVVEAVVDTVNLPDELWIANYNCPGQIVLSGTLKGIELAAIEAKKQGAKRVLPLAVHGAFHSGLMKQAEEQLAPFVQQIIFGKENLPIVMNVTGDFVKDDEQVKSNLIKQVTHSVRWEQGMQTIEKAGTHYCIEFGPGRTLAGLNKRMSIPTLTIEKIQDLNDFDKSLKERNLT